MRLASLFLAVCIAATLACTGSASAQSTGGCRGFTGHWLTTWPGGTTKMHIVGTKGAYDYLGGTLTGAIDGNVFSGSYGQSNGAGGTFRFVLSDDGNSFKGWYASSAAPTTHNTWTGICSGP